MAVTTGLEDWELLHSADAAAPLSSLPSAVLSLSDSSYSSSPPAVLSLSNSSYPSSPPAVDDGGAIKRDYFSLDPPKPQPPSEAVTDDAGIDADNSSWIEPDSHITYRTGQLNFARSDSGIFVSDESEKGEVEWMTELALPRIDPGEEEVEELGLRVSADGGGGEKKVVGVEELGLRVSADGGGGEKKGVAWWKMPFEVLKLCVMRVRPLWPIPVAAAFVGMAILGRRMYMMKQRGRSVPMRIAMEDKKVSPFKVRAARLNDAFSVARRLPLVRPALPAVGGATPWSLVS